MANSLKYYYDIASQPSRAMYIILKLSKTQFESVPIALRRREHLTEQYKTEINRFQKIPCIIDNGFKLSESISILRYLHTSGRIADHLYPSDIKLRAKIDEFLQWQHNNVRLNCGLYFVVKWRDPGLTGIQPKKEKIEKLKDNMDKSLDEMENLWLDSHKFIASDSISAADIFAACEIEQPKICLYEPTGGRPKLKLWLQAVRDATNPFYDEAHAIINKYAANEAAKLKL